ncbi:MAG: SUMF1/EgtB/PvdO family nonheme iron enzyme [Pirellulaceae bacterium]
MDQKHLTVLLVCVLLLTCSNASGQQSPEELLLQRLRTHCGQCHTGPQRVVKRFDMSQIDSLKKNALINVGNPLESPIWVKVNTGKMPPPTAKQLTNADKAKLKQLIAKLGEPTMDRGKVPVQTIQEYVEQNKDLTSFVAWAKQSKVWDDLPKTGSYTIFLPSNQAVADLGEANQKFLTDPPPDTKFPLKNLRSVVLSHGVVLAKLRAKELKKMGKVWTLMTEATIREDGQGLWIADARIIQPDVECSNGIVHVIDKVLVPASIIFPPGPVPNAIFYWPNVEMVSVPGGQFLMGAPANEVGRFPNDGPQHLVALRSFQIGVCEVMQAQFRVVMKDPSAPAAQMPGLRDRPNDGPVQNLTWYQAAEFCNEMSKHEGLPAYYLLKNLRQQDDAEVYDVTIPDPTMHSFRLPTEAEWEYACRANNAGAFCFGNNVQTLDDYAWHAGNVPDRGVNPVRMKKPNAFALYDMHGNVSEWCHDWYELNYSANALVADPLGPANGELRVVRGGSYMWYPEDCRSAARFPARSHAPSYHFQGIGFRVARYLPPEMSGEKGFADAK